ncbi:PaaI family thioesterase [Jhaorihella thermophila]|nr:PaaI family thioesterase [Jhaorihella thermophila]
MSSRPHDPAAAGLDLIGSGAQDMVGYDIDLSHHDGGARIILDIAPRHLNRVGSLHGGIVAMLLDAASGFAASRSWSEDGDALLVTVALNTQYIASAHQGRVIATGYVTGGGKTIRYADAELRAADGRLLAKASGVFKRISERRGK